MFYSLSLRGKSGGQAGRGDAACPLFMALLEIENLRKTYRTPDGRILPVVDVPSFRIEPGEQVALSGPSGTGKTTFLNLIAGILAGDSGRITLDGQDLAALSEAARDRHRDRDPDRQPGVIVRTAPRAAGPASRRPRGRRDRGAGPSAPGPSGR